MKKYRSKSTQEYLESLDKALNDIERIAFQKTYITYLEKEIELSETEKGFLKSEKDELKYQLESLNQKLSRIQETTLKNDKKHSALQKCMKELENVRTENVKLLKFSDEDKIKIKESLRVKAMQAEVDSYKQKNSKLESQIHALFKLVTQLQNK